MILFLFRAPVLLARSLSLTTPTLSSGVEPREEAVYTKEHWDMRDSLRKLIDKEINPYVDEWEAARSFPAHDVSSRLARLTFFLKFDGITDRLNVGLFLP